MKNNNVTSFVENPQTLAGSLLLSSPFYDRDAQSQKIIYIIPSQDNQIITGFSLNVEIKKFNLISIFKDMGIDLSGSNNPEISKIPIFIGGPTQSDKGFIIHSNDYHNSDSVYIENSGFFLTKNIKILKDISKNNGPEKALFILGCNQWRTKEICDEIKMGKWIIMPENQDMIFKKSYKDKWSNIIESIGIKPYHTSAVTNFSSNKLMC